MNLIIALLALAAPGMQDGEDVELRAVWLNPWCFDTDAKRESLIEKVRTANLNTIFLAVPPLEGNFGYSKPADFDAMRRGLRDLSVHGWILNHHRKGWGKPVDFADPAEREAQKSWALGVLRRYPDLDGIHFDYIRYPKWESPDPAKMGGVTETVRLTRKAMDKDHPGRFLTCTSFIAASANYEGSKGGGWAAGVPEWYRSWYRDHPDNWYVRQGRARKDLREDWLLGPSCFHYQQDPRTWLEKAGVDGVFPMQYTSTDRVWKDEVELWKSFLGKSASRVYSGLGWLTEEGQPDWKHDAAALVRFIRYGRGNGMKGFALFTLGVPEIDDAPLIRALSGGDDAPFARPARSPLARPR